MAVQLTFCHFADARGGRGIRVARPTLSVSLGPAPWGLGHGSRTSFRDRLQKDKQGHEVVQQKVFA